MTAPADFAGTRMLRTNGTGSVFSSWSCEVFLFILSCKAFKIKEIAINICSFVPTHIPMRSRVPGYVGSWFLEITFLAPDLFET